MHANITLEQALCGGHLTINTLDGRQLMVALTDIVRQDSIQLIENEGMPIPENPDTKGSLIIYFNVLFPKSLTPLQKAYLKSLLQHLEY